MWFYFAKPLSQQGAGISDFVNPISDDPDSSQVAPDDLDSNQVASKEPEKTNLSNSKILEKAQPLNKMEVVLFKRTLTTKLIKQDILN